MRSRPLFRAWGVLLLAVGLASPVGVANAAPTAVPERTKAAEARRVDRVPTPRITWVEDVTHGGYAGSVKLPLDYDSPGGAKVRIALFKVPAADPERKLGTLFLNPGGPGGSGVATAMGATRFLSQSVLDRFDIVGFDPRGTNRSTEVTCFSSPRKQAAALGGRVPAFPTGGDLNAFLASSKKLATACSKYGAKLASAMSTAQVARDLDVLRRAVGDSRLTFLGFSYGSYLGQVYANLFPERFRAIAIDGVLDPKAWAGTKANRSVPAATRLGSAEASWAALRAGLAACADAGPAYCALSDPQADFDEVAASLQGRGVRVGTASDGFDYSYPNFISDTLGLLYYPQGMDYIVQTVAALKQLTAEQSPSITAAARSRAGSLIRTLRASVALSDPGYDNGLEAYSAVLCTDSWQPKSASAWRSAVTSAEQRAPHFGQIWGWSDVQCATSSWKARDEDAYHGSYTRTTAAPVLVVGNDHDPATSFAGAVAASRLMPNSVLLRSRSWGHTAYGTSDCVTDRVDAYLLTGSVPAGTAGTVCTGDVRPFMVRLSGTGASGANTSRLAAPSRTGLVPVEVPWLDHRS